VEHLLCTWVVVAVICAFLAAASVPDDQWALAGVLGAALGPFGVLAAILIFIRRAIEGERPQQSQKPLLSSPTAPTSGIPKPPPPPSPLHP
jgi:hypothetical protein